MSRIVRKKERFRQTVRIFLSIQENLHWILRIHSTVYIERIKQHNKSFERTAINQHFRIMNSRLLKKLEEIKKEYETSEVCMGEILDSVSADGFSIDDANWLYMRAMEWANGDKFYIHIGESEDVLSKDELEEANLIVLE